jgi:hypothetical protein
VDPAFGEGCKNHFTFNALNTLPTNIDNHFVKTNSNFLQYKWFSVTCMHCIYMYLFGGILHKLEKEDFHYQFPLRGEAWTHNSSQRVNSGAPEG